MIREYMAGDTDAVMEIWLKGNCGAHDFLPASFWQSYYGEVRDEYLPASMTFVDEDKGRITGFVSLVAGERYYIGALFVSGQDQGKGIGTRLLNRCKSVWPELTLDVFEQNEKAVRFYLSQGFCLSSHKIKQGTGCYEYSMVYRKPLETERLLLRDWRLEDAGDLYEYARRGEVGPAAGWKPHESLEESREVISRFLMEAETYAIVLKENQKVIGSIGLHKKCMDLRLASLSQRMIGYVLNPVYWGRGIMPEAVRRLLDYGFDELNLDLIWCGYYDFNHKSKRVVEKCGFRYEFTRKEQRPLLEGGMVNLVYNSIRNEDYRRNKSNETQE